MSIDRMKRVDEMIRREISQIMYRLVEESELDRAAVTVTRVETARNLRTSRVYVSIRDHEDEREQMLSVFKRHRIEMQAHLNRVLNLKYTPKLIFRLDGSVEQGDRVLDVLLHLDEELPPPSDVEDRSDLEMPDA